MKWTFLFAFIASHANASPHILIFSDSPFINNPNWNVITTYDDEVGYYTAIKETYQTTDRPREMLHALTITYTLADATREHHHARCRVLQQVIQDKEKQEYELNHAMSMFTIQEGVEE